MQYMLNDMLKPSDKGWKWHWNPNLLINVATFSLSCYLSCVSLCQDMCFRNVILLNPLNSPFLGDIVTLYRIQCSLQQFSSKSKNRWSNSHKCCLRLQAFMFISISFIITIAKIHIVYTPYFAPNQLEERPIDNSLHQTMSYR